jgi:hypothetical protein
MNWTERSKVFAPVAMLAAALLISACTQRAQSSHAIASWLDCPIPGLVSAACRERTDPSSRRAEAEWARAHAPRTIAQVPERSLVGKDLKTVRASLLPNQPVSEEVADSVLRTSYGSLQIFDQFTLLSPGYGRCQSVASGRDGSKLGYLYDYVFVDGRLQRIALLYRQTFHREATGALRGDPPNLTVDLEDGAGSLPLEGGFPDFVRRLSDAPSPSDGKVRSTCTPNPGAIGVRQTRAEAAVPFATLKLGDLVAIQSYVSAHAGTVYPVYNHTRRYVVLIFRQRPLWYTWTVANKYWLAGIRDGRVEWEASGMPASLILRSICHQAEFGGECSLAGLHRL